MTSDPRTVPAALDRMAHQLPDHDALITDDRSFTAAALRDEVHRAAAALIALGVKPGDRVAIWSPNTWHWVVACLAIHHAGAAMVPLNTRYTAEEAADILARTAAPVLFAMGRFLGADRVSGLDRDALPALRHIVRIPIVRRRADGTWDEFMAGGTRHRRGRRPRRRRHARRRQRHPVHLRHHRPQQRRALRAPAIAVGLGVVGRQRQDHQRRPLPVHQPVLPQLRLQGRHPGLPADRRDADPAPDLRPAARAAGDRATPHHRAARAAHHLPDPAGPSGAPRLRPELAAVRGDRRGHRAGRAGGTHAVRTRHRHRADRLRPDRGQRHGHHVPRRRRRGHRRHHLRAPVRRLRTAHRLGGARRSRRGVAARART